VSNSPSTVVHVTDPLGPPRRGENSFLAI
jgi:hypothetical protein